MLQSVATLFEQETRDERTSFWSLIRLCDVSPQDITVYSAAVWAILDIDVQKKSKYLPTQYIYMHTNVPHMSAFLFWRSSCKQ